MYFGRMKGMAALALLLTLPVAACDDSATDMQFGSVSILLTDASGDEVVEAWVEISDMYLQQAPGDVDPVDSRATLLQNASQTYELLSLANDVAGLVNATAPAGTYGQLRIIIPQACLVTAAGSVYASEGYAQCGTADGLLQMPSYGGSGVKILLNKVDVTAGQENLLLDFDVSQSFGRLAGASGVWVMDPVIRGARISAAAGVHVTLSRGSVSLPDGYDLGQFSATLLPTAGDSSRVDFTASGSEGSFDVDFEFLLPENGPFDVRLNGPDGLEFEVSPDTPVTVSPVAGETSAVDWVIQSASDGGVICPTWVCF
jgi:hypothetical protein